MNRFRQHIPTFVDLDRNVSSYDFETTDDLLALEVIRRYAQRDDFSHFSICDNSLMGISDSGFHWWVVGSISNPQSVDLPKWDSGKYRALLPNGEEVILSGSEVGRCCGDVITLKDGGTAKDLGYPVN